MPYKQGQLTSSLSTLDAICYARQQPPPEPTSPQGLTLVDALETTKLSISGSWLQYHNEANPVQIRMPISLSPTSPTDAHPRAFLVACNHHAFTVIAYPHSLTIIDAADAYTRVLLNRQWHDITFHASQHAPPNSLI